jgi:hypothetical protein
VVFPELMSNNLGGVLNVDIGNLYELAVFDISDNAVSGPIPDSLSECRSLGKLILNENTLTGSIPESLGVLLDYSLQLFDASFNLLSGSLPQWVSAAPNSGTVVKLDHNPFACPIPPADFFSGATCVDYPITNLQPKCLQSNSVELVWGRQWPQGVDLYCGFAGVGSSFLAASLAEMLNPDVLSCNTPDFGSPSRLRAVYLNIFLQDPTLGPAIRITNESNPISLLGTQSCPLFGQSAPPFIRLFPGQVYSGVGTVFASIDPFPYNQAILSLSMYCYYGSGLAGVDVMVNGNYSGITSSSYFLSEHQILPTVALVNYFGQQVEFAFASATHLGPYVNGTHVCQPAIDTTDNISISAV